MHIIYYVGFFVSQGAPPSVGVVSLSPNKSSPAQSSREERQQKMKLKREQQRRQRQAKPKLGLSKGNPHIIIIKVFIFFHHFCRQCSWSGD